MSSSPSSVSMKSHVKVDIDQQNGKKRKTTSPETTKDQYKELLDEHKKLQDDYQKLQDELAKANKLIESLQQGKEDQEEENEADDSYSLLDTSDPWTIMFLQLREYRILNGNCKVPQNYSSNPSLGIWVNNQKMKYNSLKIGKKSPLTPERIYLLDTIGFYWGKKYPDPVSWETRYEELDKYQKAMKTCTVPIHKTNPTPLAKWVSAQRTEYNRQRHGQDSLLTLDQIEKLDAIGFDWNGERL